MPTRDLLLVSRQARTWIGRLVGGTDKVKVKAAYSGDSGSGSDTVHTWVSHALIYHHHGDIEFLCDTHQMLYIQN